MDLDTSWIDEFNQEEKKYNEFYKQEINGIRIVLFFINENNELFSSKKYNARLENNMITKNQILNILKNNISYNNSSYTPSFILKFNIDLDPENINSFIEHPNQFNFLTPENYMTDIHWSKTIKSLQPLNTLYVLMKRRRFNNNNFTKRVYISKKTRKRKTRRKYI